MMDRLLTDFAKRILHRTFCTACGLGIIYVTVLFVTGMEPHEFWRL